MQSSNISNTNPETCNNLTECTCNFNSYIDDLFNGDAQEKLIAILGIEAAGPTIIGLNKTISILHNFISHSHANQDLTSNALISIKNLSCNMIHPVQVD